MDGAAGMMKRHGIGLRIRQIPPQDVPAAIAGREPAAIVGKRDGFHAVLVTGELQWRGRPIAEIPDADNRVNARAGEVIVARDRNREHGLLPAKERVTPWTW